MEAAPDQGAAEGEDEQVARDDGRAVEAPGASALRHVGGPPGLLWAVEQVVEAHSVGTRFAANVKPNTLAMLSTMSTTRVSMRPAAASGTATPFASANT